MLSASAENQGRRIGTAQHRDTEGVDRECGWGGVPLPRRIGGWTAGGATETERCERGIADGLDQHGDIILPNVFAADSYTGDTS